MFDPDIYFSDTVILDKAGNVEDLVEKIYARFDKDEDGVLDVADIAKMARVYLVQRAGIEWDWVEFGHLMKELDSNKDGKITYTSYKSPFADETEEEKRWKFLKPSVRNRKRPNAWWV